MEKEAFNVCQWYSTMENRLMLHSTNCPSTPTPPPPPPPCDCNNQSLQRDEVKT